MSGINDLDDYSDSSDDEINNQKSIDNEIITHKNGFVPFLAIMLSVFFLANIASIPRTPPPLKVNNYMRNSSFYVSPNSILNIHCFNRFNVYNVSIIYNAKIPKQPTCCGSTIEFIYNEPITTGNKQTIKIATNVNYQVFNKIHDQDSCYSIYFRSGCDDFAKLDVNIALKF